MRDEYQFGSEQYALCPLDGRYSQIAKKLAPYFSEYALVENRVFVEVSWLQFLLKHLTDSKILNTFDMKRLPEIISIYKNFSEDSYRRVKEIEAEVNHDVKAVELFVAEQLEAMGMGKLVSYVHIGCTSEDINNVAYARMIQQGIDDEWLMSAYEIIGVITDLADRYTYVPMLAHTHGQPATPTTVGKEFAVYAYRLRQSIMNVEVNFAPTAKFNGATGNYSALSVAFPCENWPELSKQFVENYLHLKFNPLTTQIESHDYICYLADAIRHFNNVLLDFDVDMWLYISKGYFKQVAVKKEVGSSTMPHKVNPIKFENSESNIDMSNAILMALSNKLPRSRMQRDLSDSSSMRNIGMGIGYSLQAITQTVEGLNRVEVNQEKLSQELEERWEVLAEPIQTVLRKYGMPDAYDKLKELTRGKSISKETIHEFINSLDMLSKKDKETLLNLTPSTYIGLANQIVEEIF